MNSKIIKNNKKRILSMLLVAVLVIGLIPAPSSVFGADDMQIQDVGANDMTPLPGENGAKSLTDGAIWTDKSVNPIGDDGEFEITLKAVGQDYKILNPKPSECLDVVLVLDTSGSMNEQVDNKAKIDIMGEAAQKAVDTLLSVNGNRVAIVEYAGESYDVSKGFSTDGQYLKDIIDKFVAGGGTNIQQAFYKAQNIIKNRIGIENKPIIILMSDGRPTYYYDFDNDKTLSKKLGNGYYENTNGTYVMNTIKQAMAIKAKKTDIYTIGFGVINDEYAIATLMPTEENTRDYRNLIWSGQSRSFNTVDGKAQFYQKRNWEKNKWKDWSDWKLATPDNIGQSHYVNHTLAGTAWTSFDNLSNEPKNTLSIKKVKKSEEFAPNSEWNEENEGDGEINRKTTFFKAKFNGTEYHNVQSQKEPFSWGYWSEGSSINSSNADSLMEAFTKIVDELTTYKPMTYTTSGSIKTYSDIVISDVIGDGFEFVGDEPEGVTVSGSAVTWRIDGNDLPTMEAGSTTLDENKIKRVTFKVKIKDSAAAGKHYTNQSASATFSVPDQNPNPEYTTTDIVQRLANTGWLTLFVLPVESTITITKNIYGPASGDRTFDFGIYSDEKCTSEVTKAAITVTDNTSNTVSVNLSIPATSFTKDEYGNYIYRLYAKELSETTDPFWTYDKYVHELRIDKNTRSADVTFTNTYAPKGTLEIKKEWQGIAPDGVTSVAIQVLKAANADATDWVQIGGGDYQINEEDGWKLEIGGLELDTEYRVQERESLPDYTATYSPSNVTFTKDSLSQRILITNKYVQPKGHITIQKIWNDADNADGFRPDEVAFKYTEPSSNEEKVLTVKASNEWKNTLETITFGAYTFTETVPEDYTSSNAEQTAEISLEERDTTLTFTNDYKVPLAQLTVKKDWKDDNEATNFRPDSIAMKLFRFIAGEDEETKEEVQSFHLKASNAPIENWTKVFKDLPFGKYGVEEISVADYNTSYSAINVLLEKGTLGHTDKRTAGIIVTNTFKNPKGSITVMKNWVETSDLNEKEFRPSQINISLMNGISEVDSVILTGSAVEDVWTHTFDNLPLDGTTYTVEESAVESEDIEKLEKYTQTIEYGGNSGSSTGITIDKDNRSGTATITNTNANGTITVKKDWVDKENPVDERPEEATITLFKETKTIIEEDIIGVITDVDEDTGEITTHSGIIGTTTREAINSSEVATRTLDRESLSTTFYDLEMDENISYYVVEDSVPFYDTTYSNDGNIILGEDLPNAEITVGNTYTDPKGTLTVNKIWEHGNSPSHPSKVEFELYKVGVTGPIKTLAIDSPAYSCTFEDLDIGSGYYVFEKKVEHYNTKLEANAYSAEKPYVPVKDNGSVAGGSVTITNTYIPATGDLEVIKQWEGITGAAIKITITRSYGDTQDPDYVGTLDLNSENRWIGKIQNLPVYGPGGIPYKYKVAESGEDLHLYISDNTKTPTLTENETTELVIINKYAPDRGTLTIKKDWVEASAPVASISAILYKNGNPQEGTIILGTDNEWTVVLENMDLKAEYKVKEESSFEEFNVSYSGPVNFSKNNLTGTLTITNTKNSAEPGLSINKEVVGNNSAFLDENGGAVFKYKLTITNTGNRTLHDVNAFDVINASSGAIVPVGVYMTTYSAIDSDGSVIFDVADSLAPNNSITFEYKVKYNSADTYVNTAKASAVYSDLDNTIYSESEEATVIVKPAGLKIVKDVSGSAIVTANSGTFIYDLKIQNTAGIDLENVKVKDIMGLNGAKATYTYSGDLNYDDADKIFTIGFLENGQIVNISYNVTIDRPGVYKNVATVTGNYGLKDTVENEGELESPIIILTDSDDAEVEIRKPSDPIIPSNPGQGSGGSSIGRDDVVIPDEAIPAAPILEIPPVEQTILDEKVPAAPLPKTGGVPAMLLYGVGALLAGGGLILRKRQNKGNAK